MQLSRAARIALTLSAALAISTSLVAGTLTSAERSPEPETVAWLQAWRMAEAFAAAQPGREVVVGRGDSMLPLYRDRTVLVLEAMQMSAWRAGMTVVFIGDQGRPVAHTLVSKTSQGWIACGLGNSERDRTLVRSSNYIGTVVRAFVPTQENSPIRAGTGLDPNGIRVASTAGQ